MLECAKWSATPDCYILEGAVEESPPLAALSSPGEKVLSSVEVWSWPAGAFLVLIFEWGTEVVGSGFVGGGWDAVDGLSLFCVLGPLLSGWPCGGCWSKETDWADMIVMYQRGRKYLGR